VVATSGDLCLRFDDGEPDIPMTLIPIQALEVSYQR
jgi:hypothetical protein